MDLRRGTFEQPEQREHPVCLVALVLSSLFQVSI